MGLSSIKKLLLPNAKEVLVRFPIPIFFAFAFTFLTLAEIHKVISFKNDILGQYLAILFCGVFSSISVKLYGESKSWKNEKSLIISVIIFAGIAFLLNSKAYMMHSLFLATGLVLSIFVAPFFLRKTEETACCHFDCAVAISIFFAAIATIILCLGASAAFASVGYLFEIKIPKKLYPDIWLIGCTFFAPYYALSCFPKKFDSPTTEQKYPKGIEFIVSYILSPLVLVYFLILYAYAAKILMQWQLPRGNVSYMVTSFGAVGVLTHLLAYPLKNSGNKCIQLVTKYFYHALIAPVILLFLAVGVRISDYGVTEQRYTILLVAVWLAVSAGYAVVTKAQKLKIVPLLLCILLIFASFGPWGAISTSANSQMSRLIGLLEKYEILQNNQIVRYEGVMPVEDNKTISSIVDYLNKTKKLDLIHLWFSNESYINTNMYRRNQTSKIMEDMGLTYISKWGRRSGGSNFSLTIEQPEKIINVKGFDYVTKPNRYVRLRDGKAWSDTLTLKQEVDLKVELNINDGIFKISDNRDHQVAFDLNVLLKNMPLQHNSKVQGNEAKKFTLNKFDDDFSTKLLLHSLQGKRESGVNIINGIRYTLLISLTK
jgi:hypothetical protein